MDTSTRDLECQERNDERRPLLDPIPNKVPLASTSNKPIISLSTSNNGNNNNGVNNAMSNVEAGFAKALKSTADLAKHLPTGCVLIFQILSPVFTNQGDCDDVNRSLTFWLVIISSVTVFFLNFTDSFVDSGNNVRYVVAIYNGLWVIDGTPPPDPEIATTYRVKFIDFLHAVISVMIFASIALFDNNIESCFYPVMSSETREILTIVPLATGLIGSSLFVVFPSTRRGIGFPALSS